MHKLNWKSGPFVFHRGLVTVNRSVAIQHAQVCETFTPYLGCKGYVYIRWAYESSSSITSKIATMCIICMIGSLNMKKCYVYNTFISDRLLRIIIDRQKNNFSSMFKL